MATNSIPSLGPQDVRTILAALSSFRASQVRQRNKYPVGSSVYEAIDGDVRSLDVLCSKFGG